MLFSHRVRWLASACLIFGPNLLACDDGGGGGSSSSDAASTDAGFEDTGTESDGGEPCGPGTEDCRCLSDGTCRLPSLSCSAGYCRDLSAPCDRATERCPPETPVCYTPCRANLVEDDGSVRVCAPDGLMRGCLPGAMCMDGSCTAVIEPGAQVAPPGACAYDAQCPDFQVCLRGQCYAECESRNDCRGLPGNPRECSRRVCREACKLGEPCTDPSTFCDDGLCQPLAPADLVESAPPTGAFVIAEGTLTFSATKTERAITLTNVGSGPLDLTVSKVEQITIAPDDSIDRSTELALPWLTLNGQRGDNWTVSLAENETLELILGGAGDQDFSRWTGRLKVSGEGIATQEIRLVYSTGITGRWTGTAFVFGNFNGGQQTDTWAGDPTGGEPEIPNAFMRVWASYRNGGVSLDEMGAIIQATITGSWDEPRVRALCRAAGFDEGTVCAPFNNADGVIPYTTSALQNPVPSGVLQTDLSIEVRAEACDEGGCAVGRIDSEVALQYPGDPEVRLVFANDPGDCEREDSVQGCVTTFQGFDAAMVISGRGGRSSCPSGVTRPWLVNGFPSPSGGDTYRECRSTGGPYADSRANEYFAEANPIPDGTPRRRRLELVDGLLIEQNIMSLILRETIDPFHGDGAPLVSYSYVLLTREPADPGDLRPQGNPQQSPPGRSTGGPICDPTLLRQVSTGILAPTLSQAQLASLARILVTGSDGEPEALPANLAVHSLCIWDEQVGSPEVVRAADQDGNPNVAAAVRPGMVRRAVIDAGPDGVRPCIPGAEIIYFAVESGVDPSAWACNTTFQAEDCLTELQQVVERGDETVVVEAAYKNRFSEPGAMASTNLVMRCADGQTTCADDRFDLTAGKEFYLNDGSRTFFAPLDSEVARAFRYKTTFANRAGTSLGFSPSVCRGDVRPDPYCYDPEAIDAVRERVDCLLEVASVLQGPPGNLAIAGLQRVFGALGPDSSDPILSRGFEDLYAELLILLGDEALTTAYTARYALDGGAGEPFEGDLFEPDGINLSGIAGTEMAQLHRAVQSYDLVLNRFFGLVPTLWGNAVNPSVDGRFVTDRTVSGWMERVIRASTQRARALSEIARRYQTFNRPDLALTVIRRGYVRAHQEGLVLAAFTNAIADQVAPERKDGVRRAVSLAQVRYRVALLEMADRHALVAAGTDFFGLTKGYVPFPALDEDSVSGLEVMLDRAFDRMELAASDEERAIAERREFDSNAAAFRGELVTQRNSFEAQLGALCGTFLAADGRVWPAISRYADRLPPGFRGDPCGRVGNGGLWLQAGNVQGGELALTRVRQEAQNALDGMYDTFREVEERCGLVAGDAERFLQSQGAIDAIEGGIEGMAFTISIIDKLYDFTTELTGRVNDLADTDSLAALGTKLVQNVAWGVAGGVHLASTTALEATILSSQAEIRRKARDYEGYTIKRECDYLRLEAGYAVREQEREFLLTKLDTLNTIWDLDVELAALRGMHNERVRIEAEWADTEQLAVDAAGAQSDPTRRIYKNDAIKNAERSFEVALRAAWQATLTFEYYTGTTYPKREALFLARLVERGDVNLRRYMEDLREDFFAFEQIFGNADTRVSRVSLCNDVLKIPRINTDGTIRSLEARVKECRAWLQDPANLDPTGALRIPFATDFSALSPRTANHKILFVEVGLHGDLGGDGVARIYLEANGTGAVEGTDDQRRYFTFPARTAVINPFFSGDDGRAFGQDANGAITGPTRSIYRSYRFRERPFVQSSWALVLDQRSESVNRDIDLGALDDIVVDFFYTDFTPDGQ